MGNEVSTLIADQVGNFVDKKIQNAAFDKTYNGIILKLLFDPTTNVNSSQFGTYIVRYENTERKIKISDGLIHSVGERVKVYTELNNSNNVYAEPIVKRILPKKIIYKSGTKTGESTTDEDIITEIREINLDGNIVATERLFKIEVKNRDTNNEEVTKMTFPNGEVVEFEGWDV